MFLEVKKNLQKFNINKEDKLALSISGGVDSIVLYNILSKIYISKNIHLIHFNFKSHANADEAEKNIKYLSKINNSIFKSFTIRLNRNNFESNARDFRYKKLIKYSKKHNIKHILTAHHKNDQIETLIMKTLSNSDWISYLGIRNKYNMIIRPMLSIMKDDIIEYAKCNDLMWYEDTTNTDMTFDRNRIRFNIENNYYSDKYIKSLLLKNKDAKHIMMQFSLDYKNNHKKLITKKSYCLSFNKEILNYYIKSFLKLFMYNIINDNFSIKIKVSKAHIHNLENFISKSSNGNLFILYENINILNNRGEFLLYQNNSIDKNKKIEIKNRVKWYNTCFITKKTNKIGDSYLDYFSCPIMIYNKGVYLTHWKEGDCITLNTSENKVTKKISDIFINNKVSQIDKRYYPIVRDSNNKIIWVPNLQSNIIDESQSTKKIYWIKK